MATTLENLFLESPAHRAQLFGALDRATKLVDEDRQDPPTALPMVAAPSIVPDTAAPLSEPASALSNTVALGAAVALAGVAAFFSITGMVEVFPGAPVAVMAFAASMEAAKLIIAGWLAANWSVARWQLRTVLVALLTGLALINAAGVFGKLVEAHVAVAATERAGVSERMEVIDARLIPQLATLADPDHRISQIDAAVDESTGRYLSSQCFRSCAIKPEKNEARRFMPAGFHYWFDQTKRPPEGGFSQHQVSVRCEAVHI